MKLIAFLNKTNNDRIRNHSSELFMDCGYANGYVAVPPEHPYFGTDYDDIPVSVHGGLTFGTTVESIKNDNWVNLEFLDGNAELPDGYWVFGFDTLHCYDTIHTWPRERCVEETLKLKDQLEQMSNNIVFK